MAWEVVAQLLILPLQNPVCLLVRFGECQEARLFVQAGPSCIDDTRDMASEESCGFYTASWYRYRQRFEHHWQR